MKILYYTAGLTGSGNIVTGISIHNGFKRRGLDPEFLILSSSPVSAELSERAGLDHREIPYEDETQLTGANYASSSLFRSITSFQPDVLIVMLHWFTLQRFIAELSCRKVFLCRQVADGFFDFSTTSQRIVFQPEDYDLLLATEPWDPPFPMQPINPIVIRNREEILSRPEALKRLKLPDGCPCCLFTFTGAAEDVAGVKQMFAYLGEEGYRMVYGSDYPAGLFPVVDYYLAFDYLICGAGYNSFWEAVYFQKEAYFIPRPRHFEDQYRRVAECQEYEFDQNGADQLVELLAGL